MMHQQQPVRKRAAVTSVAILGALILVATPGSPSGAFVDSAPGQE